MAATNLGSKTRMENLTPDPTRMTGHYPLHAWKMHVVARDRNGGQEEEQPESKSKKIVLWLEPGSNLDYLYLYLVCTK